MKLVRLKHPDETGQESLDLALKQMGNYHCVSMVFLPGAELGVGELLFVFEYTPKFNVVPFGKTTTPKLCH